MEKDGEINLSIKFKNILCYGSAETAGTTGEALRAFKNILCYGSASRKLKTPWYP